jgi:hypothetical protein
LNEEIKGELVAQVLGSKDSVGQKLLWFFHILEKNHVGMPNELLNIMRFFATGQALFDRGNSGAVDAAQKDFAQLDQLERVIDQGEDRIMAKNPGGIDLSENLLDLEIRRDGNGVPLPLDSQDPALLNIRGFAPVILNVQPVNDLPAFLGVRADELVGASSA